MVSLHPLVIRFISGVHRRNWFGKNHVSVARSAFDGVEVLDGKIYFVGGNNGTGEENIAEYDLIQTHGIQ